MITLSCSPINCVVCGYRFLHLKGFVWDIAPQYGAMVIFAEHRYYGKSLPFGNDSFKDAAHLNYLTTEQALADYAVLLQSLKVITLILKHSPCIHERNIYVTEFGPCVHDQMWINYPFTVFSGFPVKSMNDHNLISVIFTVAITIQDLHQD